MFSHTLDEDWHYAFSHEYAFAKNKKCVWNDVEENTTDYYGSDVVVEKVRKSSKGAFMWKEGHLHVTVPGHKVVFSIVQEGDEVT